jgi:hypothetical protein
VEPDEKVEPVAAKLLPVDEITSADEIKKTFRKAIWRLMAQSSGLARGRFL